MQDYYRILQVHFTAEPEIIRDTYKRLVKKYHPDVNKASNADDTMKLINEAYEVLSDPVVREQYTIKWMNAYSGFKSEDNQHNIQRQTDLSIAPVKNILEQYLDRISNRKFDSAYDLLSEVDKRNISKRDFTRWQSVVSEVFELKSFECFFQNSYSNVRIKECFFDLVVDFRVKIVEVNKVMDRMEEDLFSKSVVIEKDAWRIFLGYKQLDSLIEEFTVLANLKKQKIKNKRKWQRQSNIDIGSGLLNKRGFMEKSGIEQIRYNRYGNPFSVVLCELDDRGHSPKNRLNAIGHAGEAIRSTLRALDISCRWKGKKFMILLPETNRNGAEQAAFKIKKTLLQKLNRSEDAHFQYSFLYAVAEQKYDSLNELFMQVESSLQQAKPHGDNA